LLNIVLIGCVISTESALLYLLEKHKKRKLNIAGILTQKNSKLNTDYVDLSVLAKKNNLPILYWDEYSNESEIIKWVYLKSPSLIFVIGWSKILGDIWLNNFAGKLIGFHPSKLPNNRGRHPIIWAIVLGLSDTASTFFMLNEGIDDGDILSQVSVPILYEDDSAILYKKICKVMGPQIDNIINDAQICLCPIKKPPEININYWRRRSFEDGKIDWRMPSIGIYNLVRALRPPYPGAHFFYKEKKITVWKCEEVEYQRSNIEPGKIIDAEQGLILVKAGLNAVRILEYDSLFLPQAGDYLL